MGQIPQFDICTVIGADQHGVVVQNLEGGDEAIMPYQRFHVRNVLIDRVDFIDVHVFLEPGRDDDLVGR